MRGVKGIVFDLDGTLVDTEPYHLEAWNSLVRRYGETPVAGWNDDTIGLPDTYAASKAKRLYPALSSVRGNLTDEKQSILRELIRREGRKLIFPGVEEGLRAAREAGIRLAVGTNSILLNADTTLGATGLREYFSAVVTIDLVQNGKPAPDIYARAVEELGLAPSECVDKFRFEHQAVKNNVLQ